MLSSSYRWIIFSLFFTVLFNFVYSKDVKAVLNEMPLEHKERLVKLFYSLMNDNHFAYTLLGDKPVSFASEYIITPLDEIKTMRRTGGVFWNEWKIWEMYKEQFPSKHYLLLTENIFYRPIRAIVLINKKAFVQKVDQHIDIFRKILGPHVTGEGLLLQIEKQQKFFSPIQNNQLLIGILLGYGVHNAKLFERRNEIILFALDRDNPYQKRLPKRPFKPPEPAAAFSSLEEENEFLKLHLRPFSNYHYSPIILKSVNFMADPNHPETKALKEKYQELRSRIAAIYATGNFLEINLSQLTSH
jgi:hypothetical protein